MLDPTDMLSAQPGTMDPIEHSPQILTSFQDEGDQRTEKHTPGYGSYLAADTLSTFSSCCHYITAQPTLLRDVDLIPRSKSEGDLQQLVSRKTARTAMESTNPFIGPSSACQLFGQSDTACAPLTSHTGPVPGIRTNSAPPSSTASTKQTSKPRVTFNQLPGEIKNHIYRLIMLEDWTTLKLRENRLFNMTEVPNRVPYLKRLPGLAYTNRRTYTEVSTFLLETRTLEISVLCDLHYLEDILEQIPGQKGWNSVKSIKFTQFSDLATSPARTRELLNCIARCHNVEQLTLQVKLDFLHMPDHSTVFRQLSFLSGTPIVRSTEQVAAGYDLELLFALPQLRELTFICEWHQDGPIRCTPRTMATFWDLQDWFAQGFASKADSVKTVFKSMPYNDPREIGAWTVRLTRSKSKDAA